MNFSVKLIYINMWLLILSKQPTSEISLSNYLGKDQEGEVDSRTVCTLYTLLKMLLKWEVIIVMICYNDPT